MKMRRVIGTLLCVLLLTACGAQPDSGADAEETMSPAVQRTDTVELSEHTAELTEGETLTLTAQGKPESVQIQWISNDPSVAEVDERGIVTAHTEGSCMILVQCADHPEVQDACVLTVRKKPRLVVLDAGHQRDGNREREPIGPGASEQKPKVSSGTEGVATGLPEYELNLQLALRLEQELVARGYAVVQTRRSHDVDLSNSQRAAVGNELGADAVLHIHANGSEHAEAQGAMTICVTQENVYCSAIYPSSRALAQAVVDHLCEAAGAENDGVWETDTMSGLNWSQVPAIIVETGYMSNPEEDVKLSEEAYQNRLIQGIADGLDAYFEGE